MNLSSYARRSLSAALAVAILALCTTGTAAAAAVSNTTSSSSTQAVAVQKDGPQFYSGTIIDVADDISGDVYAAGQSVTVSGNVSGDVIAAAQTINITGTVDGNVRLTGQSIALSGQVTRSGTLFAADVTVTDTGSFGGDIVGAASTMNIAGEVTRNVLVGVDRLTISGPIGGDVTYTSNNDAEISNGAVTGSVEHIEAPEPADTEPSPGAAFIGWILGLLYALVALSIITVLAGLLIPRVLHRVTEHLIPSPWKALLVGLVAAFVVPLALLLLLVTIIGAPLALAGMVVWLVLTLATFVYGAYYIGRLVLRGSRQPVVTALVGGAILIVALQIPWLNVLAWLAMVWFGLGAQLLEFQRQRPWRITPGSEEIPAAQAVLETPTAPSQPAL